MQQKADRLYQSAPLQNNDLEQRLEKRLKAVISFNNHISNIQEKITCFKDKNHKSKKKYTNYQTLNTILESVDTIVIFAATSTSITLSVTGVGLIVLPVSAGIACTLSLTNKVLHKIITNKYNKYKKQLEKYEQTFMFFSKVYRKYLQDKTIDKTEYESLCNFFKNYIDKTKKEFFYKLEYKNKNNFFSHNKLKIKPRF